MLTKNAWGGKFCTIIGGGPSLKAFNWDHLKQRKFIIAINRSFIDCPTADIWFTEDARVIELWSKQLREFKGYKIWHCLNDAEIPTVQAVDPSIRIIRCKRQDKFWSTSFEDGLSYSSNSGVGAMNIAHILGVDRMYLLGFDCRADGLRMANYHDSYLQCGNMWEVGSNAADNFKSDFEGWVAPHLKDVEVINLIDPSFESRLECWPKRDWREVFG